MDVYYRVAVDDAHSSVCVRAVLVTLLPLLGDVLSRPTWPACVTAHASVGRFVVL